jgi:hypothetical protein
MKASKSAPVTPSIPYHVLISRAVGKLDPDSPEARAALYEQERAALEDAIRRVEGEFEAPSKLQISAEPAVPENHRRRKMNLQSGRKMNPQSEDQLRAASPAVSRSLPRSSPSAASDTLIWRATRQTHRRPPQPSSDSPR